VPVALKQKPAIKPKSQDFFGSPEKLSQVLCLLLVAATLVVYNRVNQNSFVNFDDDRYITENLHVRAGLGWETVRWAFSSFEQANWHPLTWISHALDCQLFRVNPVGHHYVNLLLHAINSVLLFVFVRSATGFTWRSFIVAALFALHPANVESVAWASERKNVLSMLFFLLALGAYSWYTRKPEVRRYLPVAILFAFGLMAKPQVITFPFVLLLWDYWPLRRVRGASSDLAQKTTPRSLSFLILEKLPLFALSAASAIITMKAQSAGGAVRSEIEYPLAIRFGNALLAYIQYLGKAVWPAHLAVMYPHPGDMLQSWRVIAAVLLLAAITVAVLLAREVRYLLIGWLWFLGTLVPMIGLVQVGGQAMADRYAYFPFIGLFVMVCWGAADWAQRKRLRAYWLAMPTVLILFVFSLLTYRQIGYWRDSVTLWSHTLQVTSRNFVAEDSLGRALVNDGQYQQAIPHFRSAVEIYQRDPLGHLNICAYEQQHENFTQAIEHCRMVLQFTRDPSLQVNAYTNLGGAYRRTGKRDQAKDSYQSALSLAPQNPAALLGMGLLSQDQRDLPEAIRDFSQAVSVQASDVHYLLLARALEQSGRVQEASAARAEAARISTDLSQAQQSVDQLLSH
jgi:tetratricopeptide (TPR) repeat protein